MSEALNSTMQEQQTIKPSRDSGRDRKKRIQSIYDELYSNYERLYGEEQKEKHGIILKETGIQRSDIVLDIGCGIGSLTKSLARRSRLAVGIDISRQMLNKAKRTGNQDSKSEFVHGDAECLPFRQNSFQALFAITVILDPQSAQRIIPEVKRTLSARGLVVMTLVARASRFLSAESTLERGFRGWRLRKLRVGSDLGFFVQPR